MIQLIWLVIALPLVGVLINGLLGRRLGYTVTGIIGSLVVGFSLCCGGGGLL